MRFSLGWRPENMTRTEHHGPFGRNNLDPERAGRFHAVGQVSASAARPATGHAVDGRVSVQFTISRRSANSHPPSCLTNSSR
jgi:hypothetical protein